MNRIILIFFFVTQLSVCSVSSAESLEPLASNNSVVFSFDIDGNGKAEPLTDGLLMIRYLFGFRGNALTNGAIGSGAKRSPAQIEAYLNQGRSYLDVDENGNPDALTDGLLIMRYYFKFTGNTLINKAVAPNASRKTAAAIEALIEASFINTPRSSKCYKNYSIVTYTFLGGVKGTATADFLTYSLPGCKGFTDGQHIVDDNVTYSLANISKENGVTRADMTVVSVAAGRQETRRVTIKDGVVDLPSSALF